VVLLWACRTPGLAVYERYTESGMAQWTDDVPPVQRATFEGEEVGWDWGRWIILEQPILERVYVDSFSLC
jgi:hypothetical protein